MEKAKISPGQLFALILLFDAGTAIIRVLATKAEKDAWLAILFGVAGGLLIFSIYISLYRLYPKLPLTGYAKAILGQKVGWFLGLLYILFFIHGAARDLREGSDLLISSLLDQTPEVVVSAVMIMSIGYVLRKGIEVLARTALIFVFVLGVLAVSSNLLMYVAGIVDVDRLLPVLENGWRPIFDITLKQTFEFPYEELVCFTMLLPYLHNSSRRGTRAGFAAVLTSGILLSYSSATNIAVLGTQILNRATFPLLYTISLINIGDFMQRLDVFVVLTLIVGDFFKIAIFLYAGIMAATDLFQVSDYQKCVSPIAVIVLLVSLVLSGDFAEQIEEGDVLLVTVFLLFGVGIPLFLWMVAKLRIIIKKRS
ncbi:spore germination protein KB [Paenibacillus sp. JGP012]|uniref:GerAB/ArcD/ProY family transporter n=1 Tax=Paenibacillus sp. JGP012 TaxID=2735914 RepID=UPI00160C7A21|nr:GerAB/ArcD/ProY family transporter [Paenibacillus sp. JGP012]MBB6021713.1 spore germination protein KB [Paenibacillus sp. JGP012]